jgi:two-component system, cell cycle response regulator
LAERYGALLVVRVGIASTVLLVATLARSVIGIGVLVVGPVTGAYLVFAVLAEVARRRAKWRLDIQTVMQLVDVAYIALIMAPTGGPRSQLVFLLYVHLIAVTLLGTHRTGLRMASIDSAVFVLLYSFSLNAPVSRLIGGPGGPASQPPTNAVVLSILAFWLVAGCTSFYSWVNERELRRSKEELEGLSQMSAALEKTTCPEEIMQVLLTRSVNAFRFPRGAVLLGLPDATIAISIGPGGPPAGPNGSETTTPARAKTWLTPMTSASVTTQGKTPTSGLARNPDLGATTGEAPPAGATSGPTTITGPVVLEPTRPDVVVERAWAERGPVLVRALDPVFDATLDRLLPDARNVVVLPLTVEGEPLGALAVERGGPFGVKLPVRAVTMLNQFATNAAMAVHNARLMAEVERLAKEDALTGLANRRVFEEVLAREVARSRRTCEPLSLVVFDVDNFKRVNDTLGHQAGDDVLRQVGHAMAAAARDVDLVARYGGEEFTVILPNCSLDDAVRVAERMRSGLSGSLRPAGITLSAGVAAIPTNAGDEEALIGAADEAMYTSKRAGRDRTTRSTRRGPGVAVVQRGQSS